MMEKTRIEEIEARAAAATPGPWRLEHSGPNRWIRHQGIGFPIAGMYQNDKQANGDAEFITNSRADVDFLLSEVVRLGDELAARGAGPVSYRATGYPDDEWNCTGCGESLGFAGGNPFDAEMKFCPNCGGAIVSLIVTEPDDETGEPMECTIDRASYRKKVDGK